MEHLMQFNEVCTEYIEILGIEILILNDHILDMLEKFYIVEVL